MRRLALLIPINSERKVLLQRRTDDAPIKPGFWAFFGGHMEDGESPEDAVKREIGEELQITIDSPILFKEHIANDEWGASQRHFFIVRTEYTAEILRKQQLEGDDLGFFAQDDLPGLKIHPNDLEILKELFASMDTIYKTLK